MPIHRRPLPLAAALLAAALSSSACGIRISHDRVVSDARGVTTTITTDATNGGSAANGKSGEAAGTVPSTGTTGSSGATTGTIAPGTAGSVRGSTGGGSSTATGSTAGSTTTGGSRGDTTPVVLGQVGTFSGLAGAPQKPAQDTFLAWAKDVNSRGGLAGHQVVAFTRDDQGSPSKTQSQLQALVQDKHAVAIVGAFVPLTTSAAGSFADQSKVALIGGDVTNPVWHEHKYMFPEGGGADALTYNMPNDMKQSGLTKIASIYCSESASCTNANAVINRAAPHFGVAVTYSAQASLATLEFSQQCINAKNSGAQAIFAGGDSSYVGRIARDCAKQGFHPRFYTSALAVSDQSTSDPNLDGLTITSPVFPWVSANTDAEKHYQLVMQRNSITPSGASSQMWASTQMLEAAVTALGAEATSGPLTSALITKGLWKLKKETLQGLVPPMTYNPSGPNAVVPCTYILRIKSGAWTAPQGDKVTCY